jgi:hypothetical protein
MRDISETLAEIDAALAKNPTSRTLPGFTASGIVVPDEPLDDAPECPEIDHSAEPETSEYTAKAGLCLAPILAHLEPIRDDAKLHESATYHGLELAIRILKRYAAREQFGVVTEREKP